MRRLSLRPMRILVVRRRCQRPMAASSSRMPTTLPSFPYHNSFLEAQMGALLTLTESLPSDAKYAPEESQDT